MKELGLNPKDYDYAGGNNDYTVLRHKRGHKLKIAHNVLDKKNRETLQAFAEAHRKLMQSDEPEQKAEGGSPGDSLHSGKQGTSQQGMDVRSKDYVPAKKEATGRAEMERHNKPKLKGLAGGGEVCKDEMSPTNGIDASRPEPGYTKMAAGGQAFSSPYDEELPCLNPNCKSHGKAHPNCRCYSGGERFAGGGEVSKLRYCAHGMPHSQDCKYYKEGGHVSQSSPNMVSCEQPFNEGGEAQKQPDTSPSPTIDPQKAQQAQEGQQNWDWMKALAQMPENVWQGLQKARGGQVHMYAEGTKDGQVDSDDVDVQNDQDGPIQVDVGQPNVIPNTQVAQSQNPPVPMADNPNIEQASSNANQAVSSLYSQEQARKDEAKGMVEDANSFGADNMAGHIKPKTYSDLFQDKNTFQKLSGLFGIIAGGMGSGLTHQPNVALQMMDKVIANDLDAQKANVTNKQNMWNSTYTHMLQEAQSRGLDANSQLVQQEAAEKANTLSNMYTNQGFLGQMASKVANMPEGQGKEGAKKALYFTAQGVDMKHATLADQLAARMIMLDKSGKGWNALQGQQQSQQRAPQMRQGPSASKSSVPSQPQGKKYQILGPGAEGKYEDIMNDLDPLWSKNKDAVNQQYTQAQQAEKMLNGPSGDGKGGIDDVMNQMSEAQNKMGVWGHLHKSTQENPGIIGEAEAAVSKLVPPTESEKKYNALQTTLESDMGTALQGIMTPTDIHSAVSKYAPAYQDTPKDAQWKKEQLVNLIKKALHTSTLTGAGLVKKK